MKKVIKNILQLCIPVVLLAGVFSACQQDDDVTGGEPVIDYVRVTDPAAADSLLVGSSLGNLLAIVGKNLGGVQEIWFNDMQANLSPPFITDRTILVNVPNRPPADVTNHMVLKFADGRDLVHDFVIEISAPDIERLKSEHVADGDELVILGEFFFEPMTVTFPGDVEAEIVSVSQNEVRVTVPEGAESGPISVRTNFGRATTTSWFRDDRNIWADMNGGTEGWWHGPNFIVEEDADVPNINGNFLRLNTTLDDGQWFEFLVANTPSDMPTQNIPDDAIRNPADYNLKFEINTLSPLIDGTSVFMYIGNNMPGERNDRGYSWQPELDTNGEWETITISFEQIINQSGAQVSAGGYGVSFWFWQGVPMDLNIALDNFRVTPK